MLTINDQTILRDLKAGIINPAELSRYLLNTFSAPDLAKELAECMIQLQVSRPIVIGMDECMAHFRIRGYQWQDGNLIKETRGRKSNQDM
jgi:hypothetical protein